MLSQKFSAILLLYVPTLPVCTSVLSAPNNTAGELASLALAEGVRILPVQVNAPKAEPEILLSFAGINEDHIRPALLLLKKAWFG